jgi:hypothetical protein
MNTYFGVDGQLDHDSYLLLTTGANSNVVLTFRDDKPNKTYVCFVTGRRMQLVVTCNRSIKLISSELMSIVSDAHGGMITENVAATINTRLVFLMDMVFSNKFDASLYKKHYDVINKWFTSIHSIITLGITVADQSREQV